MAFRALLPYLAMRPDCYTVRRKCAVQGRMPLLCNFRMQRRQIIKTRQDFSSRTVWTAGSTHASRTNHGLIRMSQFALPPDFPICIGRDLLWREDSILFRMPLCGNFRELAGQIIFSRDNLATGTYRTATSTQCPRIDRCLPRMPFVANPPDFASAAGSHIVCCTRSIFCGMPLCGNLRKFGCQIIFLRNHHTIGTNRTSAAHNPRFNRRFPLVSTLAHPPNRFMTARKHLLWRDFVACRMPLTS